MITEVSIYFHRLPREVYRKLLKDINHQAVKTLFNESLFDFPYFRAFARYNPISRSWFVDGIHFAYRKNDAPTREENPVYVNGFVTTQELLEHKQNKKG